MKWKVVWDKTLASARNVDITAFLGLLFCLEWEMTIKMTITYTKLLEFTSFGSSTNSVGGSNLILN